MTVLKVENISLRSHLHLTLKLVLKSNFCTDQVGFLTQSFEIKFKTQLNLVHKIGFKTNFKARCD